MKFLIFDVEGKYAHFRKFYTNTSSLSYLVPSRTVVMGIVAAILGRERDSYYEELSSDNFYIAVQKLFKTYKIVQTVNYIKATGAKELMEPKEHTQVPIEILAGCESSANFNVGFRIFATHNDPRVYSELKSKLEQSNFEYPVYLGSAPFLASVKYRGEFEAENCKDEFVQVSTVIDTNLVESLVLTCAENLALVKDRMPCDFDSERYATNVKTYIHNENLSPVSIRLSNKAEGKVYKVKISQDNYNIYISLM